MLPKLLCGSFVLANPRHQCAILVFCKNSSTTSKIFLRNICVKDISTRLFEYLMPLPLQATQCVFCIFCQIDWIPRFFHIIIANSFVILLFSSRIPPNA